MPLLMVECGLNYMNKLGLRFNCKRVRKTGKPEKPKTTLSIVKLKDKTKISKGSGMETDQAELLDVPLNQSAKVLNKNHDTEETDASTTSK